MRSEMRMKIIEISFKAKWFYFLKIKDNSLVLLKKIRLKDFVKNVRIMDLCDSI